MDWVLKQFGKNRTKAQKQYREFVREGLEKPLMFLFGEVLMSHLNKSIFRKNPDLFKC